jgi:hypothetical protein
LSGQAIDLVQALGKSLEIAPYLSVVRPGDPRKDRTT